MHIYMHCWYPRPYGQMNALEDGRRLCLVCSQHRATQAHDCYRNVIDLQRRAARYQITVLIRELDEGNGVKFTHTDFMALVEYVASLFNFNNDTWYDGYSGR